MTRMKNQIPNIRSILKKGENLQTEFKEQVDSKS